MRLLFELDPRNYDPQGKRFIRDSARCITIQHGRIAMVHSLKYDYYKFPGGGIEKGETPEDALIRETLEEAGLIVLPESVKEYGFVHRIQKSDLDGADIFVQDNYYYLCSVEETPVAQKLDDYEADEHFTLEWTAPEHAIHVNRNVNHGPKDQIMLEREALVLEYLQREGFFDETGKG
jgi:8-oxo-dGTP pyrophosphatase MutT (NUDIX family)